MQRKIDDVNKRRKYKEMQYGSKKSRTDDYTGKRVFKGNKKDAKYTHSSSKTSDTDHVTPIDVVERRYKSLTEAQQKKLANNKHNYATTNSKLNRSKGKLENHEYLKRQFIEGTPENIETSARMLVKEIESRVVMRVEATPMYIKNFTGSITDYISSEDIAKLNEAGINEGISSAMFAATLSATKNIFSVIKGQEDIGKAVKDVLIDTSATAVLGYATGVTMEALSLNCRQATLLVNGTVQITKQLMAYVKDDIDEQQLMTGVAENAAYLAAAYVGKLIGEAIIPIPCVGAYIGEMLTTAVCSEVISTIKFTKEFDKENSKMISLYRKAEREIRESQARLELIIQKENTELANAIRDGFEKIIEGIKNDTYEQIEKGLTIIGSKFGLSEEDFNKHIVTKENIFTETDEIIVIE